MLTPCLRKLYNDRYRVTLMCHPEVLQSHLLDNCKYVADFFVVPNPWKNKLGKNLPARNRAIYNENLKLFGERSGEYEWSGCALHNDRLPGEHKVHMTARELKLMPDDWHLEVFISDNVKALVDGDNMFKEERFIFIHDVVPDHPYHTWREAEDWAQDNIRLNHNVYRVSGSGNYFCENINYAFEQMRRASHRVICSSVFVHACEAMDLKIDCLYHGQMDEKVIPLNRDLVNTFICGGQVIWKH